jgi:hypothetical protein
MITYVPSSEFWNDDENKLIEGYQDQEIWNLVGNAPYILSLQDAIMKHNDWFGTMESRELLCKALYVAEKETYNRLSAKEEAPSVIMVDGPATQGGMTSGMTFVSDLVEEDAVDPVRV